jgi:NitT/TauT family transport system substrate-binding protein
MITDPDIDYTTTPANLMKHAEFMYRVSRLKRLPASWKDLFCPEAYELKGT